jgi:hypothetical protein
LSDLWDKCEPSSVKASVHIDSEVHEISLVVDIAEDATSVSIHLIVTIPLYVLLWHKMRLF